MPDSRISPSRAAVVEDLNPDDHAVVAIQRGRRFLLRLFSWTDTDPAPDNGAFAIRVAYADGGADIAPVTPAVNAEATTALDALEKRIGRKGRLKQPATRRDFVWPAPADRIARRVELAAGDVVLPWLGRQSLGCRVPLGRDEFRLALAFRKGRSPDEETLYASALDTLAHHVGQGATADTAAYIVNAFVIAAYKTIELDLPVQPLERFVEPVRQVATRLEPSPSIKEDRDVVTLSYLTALWHLAVHAGDANRLRSALEQIALLAGEDRDPLATFAFNGARGLLLLAVLIARTDPERARGLFELTYVRFRAAAGHATFRASQVRELSASLEAAVIALEFRAALIAAKPYPKGAVDMVVAACARADHPVFLEKMRALVAAEAARTVKIGR